MSTSGPPLPRLVAIVAMASNRVIGRQGRLPWHIPEDLRFFKKTTLGHPVLMGRKTFDSIGKPLPGRQNIVLSRSMPPREGVTLIASVADLPQVCAPGETVFLIGGAQLFAQLLPQCAGLYLTWITAPHEGDVLLPAFEHLFHLQQTLGHGDGFEFRYYERKTHQPPAPASDR